MVLIHGTVPAECWSCPLAASPATLNWVSFLARRAAGPEHQELIRLIGTLTPSQNGPYGWPRSG